MFSPTDEQRYSISVMAGAGVQHEEIALAFGITQDTLKEKCAEELTRGAYQRRREVLDALYQSALKGSVAAQKAYITHAPGVAAPPLPVEKKAKERRKVKPEPMGKKEQRQAEAIVAQKGTDWEGLLGKPTQ